jgi:hypothetical protein
MKKNLLITLCLLVTLFVPIANGECIYPKKNFNIPNGSKATQDELLEAKAKLNNWQAVAETYRNCLENELASIPKESEIFSDLNSTMTAKWNASVEEETDLADDLNSAIRAYNKANKAQ